MSHKALLAAVIVLGLMALPAAAALNQPPNIVVSATIAPYAIVNYTNATITFGADNTPEKVGTVDSAVNAVGTIQGNVDLLLSYNNGPDLTGTSTTNLGKTIPTFNSSQLLGGPVVFNAQKFTMGAGDWTPFGPAGDSGTIILKAGVVYAATIRCQITRNGLADLAGDYTKTSTLTVAQTAYAGW